MANCFTRRSNVTPRPGVARGFTRTYRHFMVLWENPETGDAQVFGITYRSENDSVKQILADMGIDINDCLVELMG